MALPAYTEPATVSTGDCRVLADLQNMVVDIGRRFPQFAERAMRAGIIVAAGKVRTFGSDFYEVEGAGGQVYTVDTTDFVCPCEDWANGAPPTTS